jgi:hypothetical protein
VRAEAVLDLSRFAYHRPTTAAWAFARPAAPRISRSRSRSPPPTGQRSREGIGKPPPVSEAADSRPPLASRAKASSFQPTTDTGWLQRAPPAQADGGLGLGRFAYARC